MLAIIDAVLCDRVIDAVSICLSEMVNEMSEMMKLFEINPQVGGVVYVVYAVVILL